MADPVTTDVTKAVAAASGAVSTLTADAAKAASTAKADVAAVEKDATGYFAKVKAAWAKLTVPEKALVGAGLAAAVAGVLYVLHAVL